MEGIILLLIILALLFAIARRIRKKKKIDLSHLPGQFIVFDLETTGLRPDRNEIIEIGAIRVNRDSDLHDTFEALVKPTKRIPKKITELTGITQKMVDSEGESIDSALKNFKEFVGELPMVSYNSDFDMGFLRKAGKDNDITFSNTTICALKMVRRAYPGRKSYKLADIAKDGKLSLANNHRALADCHRALIVYTGASSTLGRFR